MGLTPEWIINPEVFYTIVNHDGLYWNHAGTVTYNVMDATWFDTESEAKYTLEELDVDYVQFLVREYTIEQQPLLSGEKP